EEKDRGCGRRPSRSNLKMRKWVGYYLARTADRQKTSHFDALSSITSTIFPRRQLLFFPRGIGKMIGKTVPRRLFDHLSDMEPLLPEDRDGKLAHLVRWLCRTARIRQGAPVWQRR